MLYVTLTTFFVYYNMYTPMLCNNLPTMSEHFRGKIDMKTIGFVMTFNT